MADIYNSAGNVINRVYDKNGNLLTMCYDSQGNPLRKSHAVSSNVTRSLLMIPDIPTGTQGFACDSITQSIAQFYTGYMYFIDTTDGSAVKSNNINLGHGHTGQFAPTKTAEQEYPMLYVCGPVARVNNNPYCYLLEIVCDSTVVQLKKIYAVPATEGLLSTCQVCVDFEKRIVYLIAASTYNGEADYTYISAWDMDESETLDGATYSPTPTEGIYVLTDKLFEFQIPFVPEMQTCTFFDGLVVMLSDRSGASNKYIQFVDVECRDVYLTLNKQMLSGELEGVGFLYNRNTEQYDMIVSHRVVATGESDYHTEYHRYEFVF